LTDLKPLPAIATSCDPALRRYNLFDGDNLFLCKSLMDGKVWIPNYASPYPRGLWAYVVDEFLLGCMPINTYIVGPSVETCEYTALFPELLYTPPPEPEPKALRGKKVKAKNDDIPTI